MIWVFVLVSSPFPNSSMKTWTSGTRRPWSRRFSGSRRVLLVSVVSVVVLLVLTLVSILSLFCWCWCWCYCCCFCWCCLRSSGSASRRCDFVISALFLASVPTFFLLLSSLRPCWCGHSPQARRGRSIYSLKRIMSALELPGVHAVFFGGGS